MDLKAVVLHAAKLIETGYSWYTCAALCKAARCAGAHREKPHTLLFDYHMFCWRGGPPNWWNDYHSAHTQQRAQALKDFAETLP